MHLLGEKLSSSSMLIQLQRRCVWSQLFLDPPLVTFGQKARCASSTRRLIRSGQKASVFHSLLLITFSVTILGGMERRNSGRRSPRRGWRRPWTARRGARARPRPRGPRAAASRGARAPCESWMSGRGRVGNGRRNLIVCSVQSPYSPNRQMNR